MKKYVILLLLSLIAGNGFAEHQNFVVKTHLTSVNSSISSNVAATGIYEFDEQPLAIGNLGDPRLDDMRIEQLSLTNMRLSSVCIQSDEAFILLAPEIRLTLISNRIEKRSFASEPMDSFITNRYFEMEFTAAHAMKEQIAGWENVEIFGYNVTMEEAYQFEELTRNGWNYRFGPILGLDLEPGQAIGYALGADLEAGKRFGADDEWKTSVALNYLFSKYFYKNPYLYSNETSTFLNEHRLNQKGSIQYRLTPEWSVEGFERLLYLSSTSETTFTDTWHRRMTGNAWFVPAGIRLHYLSGEDFLPMTGEGGKLTFSAGAIPYASSPIIISNYSPLPVFASISAEGKALLFNSIYFHFGALAFYDHALSRFLWNGASLRNEEDFFALSPYYPVEDVRNLVQGSFGYAVNLGFGFFWIRNLTIDGQLFKNFMFNGFFAGAADSLYGPEELTLFQNSFRVITSMQYYLGYTLSFLEKINLTLMLRSEPEMMDRRVGDYGDGSIKKFECWLWMAL